MGTFLRMAYSLGGAAGLGWAFWVLYQHNSLHSMCDRGAALLKEVTIERPRATVVGSLLAATSVYLLGAGAVGGQLRSRHWGRWLVTALAVASVLVAAVAVYRGFINPAAGPADGAGWRRAYPNGLPPWMERWPLAHGPVEE